MFDDYTTGIDGNRNPSFSKNYPGETDDSIVNDLSRSEIIETNHINAEEIKQILDNQCRQRFGLQSKTETELESATESDNVDFSKMGIEELWRYNQEYKLKKEEEKTNPSGFTASDKQSSQCVPATEQISSTAEETKVINVPYTDLFNYSEPPSTDADRFMIFKTTNQWLKEASDIPEPKDLWMSMWYENEICCLFADSNVGKSIYAVQIAAYVARKEPIIYFDFELSTKQFQMRYTNQETGHIQRFPENLIRAEINLDELRLDLTNFEDNVFKAIESGVQKLNVKKLIIDNLSFICNASDKSDVAGRFMMRLLDLKRRNGLSILVLAHTPKRALSSPITQNDLAGSKKLINFFDSAFSIGKCVTDTTARYIKQIKVRAGAFKYDSNNVIVCGIEKRGSMLQFEHRSYCKESSLLLSPQSDNAIDDQVVALHREGLSDSEIARRLSTNHVRIGRILKRCGEKKEDTVAADEDLPF